MPTPQNPSGTCGHAASTAPASHRGRLFTGIAAWILWGRLDRRGRQFWLVQLCGCVRDRLVRIHARGRGGVAHLTSHAVSLTPTDLAPAAGPRHRRRRGASAAAGGRLGTGASTYGGCRGQRLPAYPPSSCPGQSPSGRHIKRPPHGVPQAACGGGCVVTNRAVTVRTGQPCGKGCGDGSGLCTELSLSSPP
jgi:hypothetical protein